MGPAVTTEPEPGPPSVHIQWKGTEACLDLRCRCGTISHYDGWFAYALRCPDCGRAYTLPTVVPVADGDPVGIARDAENNWP